MSASLEQHYIPFDSLAHLDIGISCKWASMLTKLQAGSVPYDQKFFCKWNVSFFKAVPPNRLSFHLGSVLHIISSLVSNFRSWDYPEHFGSYFQLDRKSETWFFTFLNVYVSWTERDKILISELSHPKFRYFADQNGPKGDPIKMNFYNFQMQKWRFRNR